MKTEKEKYFGDRKTFSIRYAPGYTDESKRYFYAFCHLVLGGQIIGDKDETCLINSWLYSVEGLKNQIKNNFKSISHFEFEGKNDEELFELICKANQLEEEYRLEFSHLPVLDNNVWSHCNIAIDETTDAFSIMMTELNGKIKFLWKRWTEPCPNERIGKVYSIVVDRQLVIETMEECLQTIKNEYLNYPTIK